MIKKIAFRGISRTPSDRMNADGGCSESLNLRLSENESVPAVAPKTKDLIPSGFNGEVLYIHKINAQENIIGRKDGKLVWIHANGTPTEIASVGTGDLVINSMGTVLMCQASDGSRINAMFKQGGYVALKGNVPFPEMYFQAEDISDIEQTIYIMCNADGDGSAYGDYAVKADFGTEFYNDGNTGLWAYDKKVTTLDKGNQDALESVKSCCTYLTLLREYTAEARTAYIRPCFFKYSIVLYDGSEIVSSPFFVRKGSGIGEDITFEATLKETRNAATSFVVYQMRYTMKDTISSAYKLKLGAAKNDLETLRDDWKDVVRGIRVYATQEKNAEDIESYLEYKRVVETPGTWTNVDNQTRQKYFTGRFEFKKPYEKKMLDDSAYFLVKEYTVEEFLASDCEVEVEFEENEKRATNQILDTNVIQEKDIISCDGMRTYNGRVLAYGITKKLYPGPKWGSSSNVPGVQEWDGILDKYYYIRTLSGDTQRVVRSDYIIGEEGTFLTYPDVNCYKMVLCFHRAWYEVPMSKSPFGSYAYYYDMDNPSLYSLLYAVKAGTNTTSGIKYLGEFDSYTPEVYPDSSYEGNKLVQTMVNNFFIYEDEKSLDGKILGLSVNTAALSAGQHGQYPIIAFTTEGIWGIGINADGTLGSSAPLPRDIALSGRIWQADNDTIFATDKTIDAISGSTVADLASYMHGKPFALPQSAVDVIKSDGVGFSGLESLICDSVCTFQSFMSGAGMSYDYNGGRFIFFHPSKGYAYVLAADTKTWHKISLPDGKSFVNTLNSYPDALVVMKDAAGRKYIYDYSTIHTQASLYGNGASLTKSVLVSRPFSLDEMDAYKKIKDIRIRGQYGKTYQESKTVTTKIGSTIRIDDSGLLSEDNLSEILYSFMFEPYSSLEDILSGEENLHIKNASSDTLQQIEETFSEYEAEITISDWTTTQTVTVVKPRVSYILLGSNDDDAWYKLGTLKGKSWKMYRLIILSCLAPSERISYAEIEYETRFTNKLR